MSLFDDFYKSLLARFSDWIKINDRMSLWTIEDFPYDTGVNTALTYPHCWECVTINQCWFKNENGKKPEEFNPNVPPNLYHVNCHCNRLAIAKPKISDIKLIIPKGKEEYTIGKKSGWVRYMGYDDYKEFFKIFYQKSKESFIAGKYKIDSHTRYGVKINLNLLIPNKYLKKEDEFFKLIASFTVFPNGKLKLNTHLGGWQK